MSPLQLIAGQILPPITILVLIAGLVTRIRRWVRAPAAKITLYPSAKGESQVWSRSLKEIFLFQSLWKSDGALWVFAWVFHVSLALIVLGHLRVFTDFPWLWAALGMQPAAVDAMSARTGGTLGIVILATGLLLLARRVTSREAREASKLEDYATLLLLLAVIVTGNAMRFLSHFELEAARAYFAGLVVLDFSRMPESTLFWVHFLLVQALIIYFPLGKLLHAPGVLFSHPLLRRD